MNQHDTYMVIHVTIYLADYYRAPQSLRTLASEKGILFDHPSGVIKRWIDLCDQAVHFCQTIPKESPV